MGIFKDREAKEALDVTDFDLVERLAKDRGDIEVVRDRGPLSQHTNRNSKKQESPELTVAELEMALDKRIRERRELIQRIAVMELELDLMREALDALLPSREEQDKLLDQLRIMYSPEVDGEAPELPDWSDTKEEFNRSYKDLIKE